MKRYFIENARCGITKGGMACGPVSGHVVVTVQYKEGTEEKWLSMVEVDGIPVVYLSDKDVHDDLVAERFEDKEFDEYMANHYIEEFEGITFGEDYFDAYNSIEDNPNNPAVPLIRYLITLVRCGMDDVERLIGMASGKYADELDIPLSDIEEEIMEEYEYEEVDDE